MSSNEQESKIVFEEIFDITVVLQYQEQLNQVLNKKKQIILNAENIEKVDGAALQLLLAFFLTANKLNLQISWVGTSELFCKNVGILGISEQLGLN